MTDPNQTLLPQNVPPSPFSPLTPEQQQQQQQQQVQLSDAQLILLQQQFNAQITSLQTFVNDLTNRLRDHRTHVDTRLTTLATSQQDLTTHVNDLRQDQTTIITDMQRIRNDMSNQQAMGTVVQNLDTVLRQFMSRRPDPSPRHPDRRFPLPDRRFPLLFISSPLITRHTSDRLRLVVCHPAWHKVVLKKALSSGRCSYSRTCLSHTQITFFGSGPRCVSPGACVFVLADFSGKYLPHHGL